MDRLDRAKSPKAFDYFEFSAVSDQGGQGVTTTWTGLAPALISLILNTLYDLTRGDRGILYKSTVGKTLKDICTICRYKYRKMVCPPCPLVQINMSDFATQHERDEI